MKNFTTKLPRFNAYENLVFKFVHYGHYHYANKKKIYEHLIRSHMTTMEASDWSKFSNADVAYLINFKTILPLVKF